MLLCGALYATVGAMETLLNLYKERYETPLARVERFRRSNPEYADVPMTYAGRLDPLAEGVLPVLAAEGVHRKEEICALTKRYELTILFGASTDSADVLGKLTASRDPSEVQRVDTLALTNALIALTGERTQRAPLYSATMHNGAYLHAHVRAGNVPEELPVRSITLSGATLIGQRHISVAQLEEEVLRATGSVQGDFRQSEIRATWEETLRHYDALARYPIALVDVTCSSGTYMRVLAEEVGEALGIEALALSIVRVSVGEMTLEESIRLPLSG